MTSADISVALMFSRLPTSTFNSEKLMGVYKPPSGAMPFNTAWVEEAVCRLERVLYRIMAVCPLFALNSFLS